MIGVLRTSHGTRRWRAPLVLVLAALASPASADSVGSVRRVHDGDTLTLLVGEVEVVVRVEGIDCPELKQPFGEAAREFTANRVLGKTVRLVGEGRDRDERLLARVLFQDAEQRTADLSLQLVGAGLAWHFTRYSSDQTLAGAERSAREAGRGLWARGGAIPPWDWRAGQRATPPPVAPRRVQAEPAAAPLHGNRNSHVFHQASCRYFDCLNCTRPFASSAEALSAGFRPCKICRP